MSISVSVTIPVNEKKTLVRIRCSVWLVSGYYAHVFILLSVVMLALPGTTDANVGLYYDHESVKQHQKQSADFNSKRCSESVMCEWCIHRNMTRTNLAKKSQLARTVTFCRPSPMPEINCDRDYSYCAFPIEQMRSKKKADAYDAAQCHDSRRQFHFRPRYTFDGSYSHDAERWCSQPYLQRQSRKFLQLQYCRIL